ncbi:hypothetical protein RRF57_001641 [Xylaria bambusicola]|uniref:Uncharacterized protein n=1 Tax=Xylaria bambusicola TaxID=326684 RepID=A0AAN7YV23_9PEZI
MYEQEICKIYVDMVRERQAAENGAPGVEKHLTVGFWEQLEDRVLRADLAVGLWALRGDDEAGYRPAHECGSWDAGEGGSAIHQGHADWKYCR